jgi:hypothetical protein
MARRPYTLAAAIGLEHLIRLHLLAFAVGLTLMATSLQFEPQKWRTPAYTVALALLTPGGWAVLCVAAALVKLTACILYPRLVPAALIVGNSLFLWFTISFTVNYVSDVVPSSPALALFSAWIVGEHLAVASLLQRERQTKKVEEQLGLEP